MLLEDGSIVQAFIKDLEPRQLANELFTAALGLAAELPIPVPILATVDAGLLPVSGFPRPGTDQHIVFASADAAASTVLQVISSATSGSPILAHLAAWNDLGHLYGFDAWVANIDRHANNLLLSGAGAVWLIDHGHSFTGPAWKPAHLVPSKAYPNRLREWMTPALSEDQRAKAAGRALKSAGEFQSTDVNAIGSANFAADILGADFAVATEFLCNRVAHVEALASQALEVLV
ncbi:MAG TPA: HipA family kinase [Allosphingosinicella sp.]|nr:HipA family kinase [Allosphingosinicella sp.]